MVSNDLILLEIGLPLFFIFFNQFLFYTNLNLTDETDDFYDAPREFHILGSCLFHRGLLVSSHLSKIDTTDVLLWLKVNRNILSLSSKYPVRRIVAWKEIFPTKLQKRNKDGKEKDKNDRYGLLVDFYDLKCIIYYPKSNHYD